MKQKYSRFCIYGNSFQSNAISGYLIRKLKLPPSSIRLITDQAFHQYEYGLLPLGLSLRDRDEIERPLLKCYNELIEITFDDIVEINYKECFLKTYDTLFYFDYFIHAQNSYQIENETQKQIQDPYSYVSDIVTIEGMEKTKNLLTDHQKKVLILDMNSDSQESLRAFNLALNIKNQSQILSIKDSIFLDKDINQQLGNMYNNIQFNKKIKKIDFQNNLVYDSENQKYNYDILLIYPKLQELNNDFDRNTLSHNTQMNIQFLGPYCQFSQQGLNHIDLIFQQCEHVIQNLTQTLQQLQNDKINPNNEFQLKRNLQVPIFSKKQQYQIIEYNYLTQKSTLSKPKYLNYWKQLNYYPYLYFNTVQSGAWGGPIKGIQNTIFHG